MKRRQIYLYLLLLTIPTAIMVVLNAILNTHSPRPGIYFPLYGGVDPMIWGLDIQPRIALRIEKSNIQSLASSEKLDRVTYNNRNGVGAVVKSNSGVDKINPFQDDTVDRLLAKLKSLDSSKFSDFDLNKHKDKAMKRKQTKLRRKDTLLLFKNYKSSELTNWQRFHKEISRYGLYNGDDPYVDGLLRDMSSEPIVGVEMKEGGTQLKLTITFQDGGKALFKPMRFPRNFETLPNHFVFNDFERHYAEIAAFHLDRVLGFNGVPPTAGRLINMTHDIKGLADDKIKNTFFISPAGNVCFYSKCKYYCDANHAICGNPDMLEGSLAAFLPAKEEVERIKWRNPWKRAYSKWKKAYWEVYDDLCEKVRVVPPFDTGRRLLDLIDLHIFDFITGNWDRHHYETFRHFGNETFMLHLDNGRGFGKSMQDDMTVLAPVYQCCLIRHSTFIKLVTFYLGPNHLSDVMRNSLKRDSVSPILAEPHFPAMDRRVMKILKAIADCILNGNRYTDVIVDDHF